LETVSIDFPKDLINIFKVREKDLSSHVRKSLAVELYRDGLISIGKAAEIAGVSIWEMLETIAIKKIQIQYYPEDLKEDIKTLNKVLR
jgi:predicted HTH domain antitoxin